MKKKDFLSGTFELVVLGMLTREEMYGYQITQELKRESPEILAVGEGTLYPMLHRMEDRGVVKSRWEVGKTGRKQRYYSVTKKGNREFEAARDLWSALSKDVNRLVKSRS